MNYLELLLIIFFLGMLFVMSFQPIFMVSVLILITFIYSYVIYMVMDTFWFSYVLLMVMLSGVLVLFTYMVTMTPNESFEVYNLVILFSMMVLLMMDYMDLCKEDFSMITVNLWVSYVGVMSLFLVGFLLGLMLLVVTLSYINEGAFRVK